MSATQVILMVKLPSKECEETVPLHVTLGDTGNSIQPGETPLVVIVIQRVDIISVASFRNNTIGSWQLYTHHTDGPAQLMTGQRNRK